MLLPGWEKLVKNSSAAGIVNLLIVLGKKYEYSLFTLKQRIFNQFRIF